MSGQGISLHSPLLSITIQTEQVYHMILDEELNLLSRAESGILGALGFTTLGACLGLLPASLSTYHKLKGTASLATYEEVSSMMICAVCFTAAVLCLFIYGISSFRKRGLTTTIRSRPRQVVVGPVDPSSAGTPLSGA